MLPLLTQSDVRDRALRVARGSNNLDKDVAEAQKTLSVRIEQTRQKFAELFRDISNSDTFKVLTDNLFTASEALLIVGRSIEKVLPLFAIVSSARGIASISSFLAGIRRGVLSSGFTGGSISPVVSQSKVASEKSTGANKLALDANTAALKANTLALNSLSRIRTTPIQRRQSGGPILGRPGGNFFMGANSKVMSGELIFPPKSASKYELRNFNKKGIIGSSVANALNSATLVPGVSVGDNTFAQLQPGSFVVRTISVKN